MYMLIFYNVVLGHLFLLSLNSWCLDDEWMSASKLKLNLDKTEFILSISLTQRDKLKTYF